MNDVFLDVETLPLGEPDLADIPDPESITVAIDDPDIVPHRGLRDPEKIAADLERKREDLQAARRAAAVKAREAAIAYHRGGALDPLRGRVLCVGVAGLTGPVDVAYGPDEIETLLKLADLLAMHRTQRVWGWNSARFDLPFLQSRALALDLPELARLLPKPTAKPWELCDLMDDWPRCGWGSNRSSGTLDAAAAHCGVSREGNPGSGAQVYDWHREGRSDLIRAHVVDDVETLRAVFLRMRRMGWV